MNILQLNFENGWRGGERQTFLSMLQFREDGHTVHLLSRAGSEMGRRARDAGFVVHECGGAGGVMGFLIRHGRAYDILHVQTGHMLTWAVLTRWLHAAPVVYSRRVAFRLKGALTRFKYRHTDLVVAISDACANSVKAVGVDDVPVIADATLPVVTDHARMALMAEKLGLAGRKVVATTSALAADKDPLMLVDAISALKKQRDDFVFVHFGTGALQEEVRARVAALQLQDHFLFAGYQQNVEALFGLFDVFVMSSREEGLGSSVLDAFSARIPVASTSAGGLKELLAEERGLLSPPGDATALAQHISALLDKPEWAAGMVERAANYYEQHHRLDTMGRGYLALFDQLLNGRRRPHINPGSPLASPPVPA
ncbi:glycosyltransferase involved in cell wall biosynthesis [Silvimonas terrae]|uniref:Glycosyltransferase involved in cell wall biosynthesis n=1 Tax=Silvimonas terrae TaxID=300266 RepID=A0A840RIA9_9NEIS|nr:glycosyltransferase family 4 protein [Silvimonas terrae]MBB5192837.1 glycosyltransferase involved in cell wall biosynthesis [Silvimonas terrae]